MPAAENTLHTQITLEIYSQFYRSAGGNRQQYWKDFFEITIHEPALIATFSSVDLSSAAHLELMQEFATELVRYFHSVPETDTYLRNNCVLIFAAFFKSLRQLAKHKSEELSTSELLRRLISPQNFESVLALVQLTLRDVLLARSAISVLLHAVLVAYGSEYFEHFYTANLAPELFDHVVVAPADVLSVVDCNRAFVVLAILLNSAQHRSATQNCYKRYLQNLSDEKVFAALNERLIHLVSFGLVLMDDARPDLVIEKSHRGSLFNLLTFNRFNRLNCNYRQELEPKMDPELRTLLQIKRRAAEDHAQLQAEYAARAPEKSRAKVQAAAAAKARVSTTESLPLNLMLYAFVANMGYLQFFCGYLNEADVDAELGESKGSDLIDLHLSYTSYVFQNQHQNHVHHVLSRLNLVFLFRLITALGPQLLQTSINQLQYKLAHQLEPTINNFQVYQEYGADPSKLDEDEAANNEYKSRILYILDVLQCFMRYNRTSHLDMISMKLAVSGCLAVCSLLITNFDNAVVDDSTELEVEDFLFEYNWNDLYVSIFLLLKTLANEKVREVKDPVKLGSLTEEVLLLLTVLLVNNAKLFKFDNYLVELVYKLLEHEKLLRQLTEQQNHVFGHVLVSVVDFVQQKLAQTQDFSYDNIAQTLRDSFAELPLTSETSDKFKDIPVDKYRVEHAEFLNSKCQFPKESLKYFIRGDKVFDNYKISLAEEGVSVVVKEFEKMFR